MSVKIPFLKDFISQPPGLVLMKIVWVKLKPKDIETKPIKGARDLHCILIDHVGLQGEFRQSKTH